MIAKDEEANLDRCLQSVRPVADEIVLVDTGSRDRTVEIARRHNARISHFQWCDDFSAARNAALAEATGEWILQFDADDLLSPEARRQMRHVVAAASPACWGFLTPCRSHILRDGIEVTTVIYRLVLFRRHMDLRYRRRIHEYIQYAGTGAQPTFQIDDDLVIDHYGYMPAQMETKAKNERNLRLLQLSLAEDPSDPANHLYLGQHLFSQRRFAESVGPLRRAIALCPDPSMDYLVDAYAMLVIALCRCGRGTEVPAVIGEAERCLDTLTSDFHCNAGEALKSIGHLDQALVHFHRALETVEVKKTAKSDPSTHTWLPRFGIGLISEERGHLENARDVYLEALAYVPRHLALNHRLALVTAKLGESQRALEHVDRILQMDAVRQEVLWELLQVCEALAGGDGDRRIADNVETIGGRLVQRITPTPEMGSRLSGACSRFGQYELGVVAANTALEREEDALARVNRGYCYFALGRHKEAADDFAAALALEPQNPDLLAGMPHALR